MYKVELRQNRLLFILALGAGLAAVCFFPQRFPEFIVEIPIAALIAGEAGLSLLVALLFYENANTTQAFRLAGAILAMTMVTGAIGNSVQRTSHFLPESLVLVSWVQLLIMNITGLLGTLCMFALTPLEQFRYVTSPLKSGLPQRPAVPAPEGEVMPPASEQEPVHLETEVLADMPVESSKDILDRLDVSRINRLEKSLRREPISLESLFSEESKAAASKAEGLRPAESSAALPMPESLEHLFSSTSANARRSAGTPAASDLMSDNPAQLEGLFAEETLSALTSQSQEPKQLGMDLTPPAIGSSNTDIDDRPVQVDSSSAKVISKGSVKTDDEIEDLFKALAAESGDLAAAPRSLAASDEPIALPPASQAAPIALPPGPSGSEPTSEQKTKDEPETRAAEPSSTPDTIPSTELAGGKSVKGPGAVPAAQAEPEPADSSAQAQSSFKKLLDGEETAGTEGLAQSDTVLEPDPTVRRVQPATIDDSHGSMFGQSVAEEIDDIFSHLASADAQAEVSAEALARLRSKTSDSPATPLEAAAAQAASNASPAATEASSPKLQVVPAPSYDQSASQPASLPQAVARAVTSAAEPVSAGSSKAVSADATKDLIESLECGLETAKASAQARGKAEPTKEEAKDKMDVAPKAREIEPIAQRREVKEFGRLSASSAQETSSAQAGTMKTIGKMLIDTQAVENIIKSGEVRTSGLTTARVVSAEQGEGIQALLEKIDKYPDVVGSLIVGNDGLVIASTLPTSMNKDLHGAMSLAIHGSSSIATRKLQMGSLQRIVIQGAENVTILTQISTGVLAVFTGARHLDRLNGLIDRIDLIIQGSGGEGTSPPQALPEQPQQLDGEAISVTPPAIPSAPLGGSSASTTASDAGKVASPPSDSLAVSREKPAAPEGGAPPEPASKVEPKDFAEAEPKAAQPVIAPNAGATFDASPPLEDLSVKERKIAHDIESAASFAQDRQPVAADLVRDLISSLSAGTISAPERQGQAATPASRASAVDRMPASQKSDSLSHSSEAPERGTKNEAPLAPPRPQEASPAPGQSDQMKEFGRLSAATGQPSKTAVSSNATMKSIGKMLVDVQAIGNIIKQAEKRGAGLTTARVISAARGEGIRSLLKAIDACSGVAGSLIVGHDGLVIASTLSPGIDKDLLGAMSSAIHGHTNHATEKLELGKLQQVILQSSSKVTVLTNVDVGVLAVFVEARETDKLDGLLEAIDTTIRG